MSLADALAWEPLPLTEACVRLGVPLRSLNADINEVLGMSAGLYWRRPRLHAACNPRLEGRAKIVTMAATRNGFREPGRFAGDYQEVFGQLTPPDDAAEPCRVVPGPGSARAYPHGQP